MKIKLTIIIILLVFVFSFSRKQNKIDYIPNETTAIKIAEAVWLPIYGVQVLEQKPYIAVKKGDYWIVTGTLKDSIDGGVAYLKIQKSDCKIIEVYHSK